MTTTPNHSNGQQIQTKSSQQEIVGSKRWNQSTMIETDNFLFVPTGEDLVRRLDI
jgi:hypothetical protein